MWEMWNDIQEADSRRADSFASKQKFVEDDIGDASCVLFPEGGFVDYAFNAVDEGVDVGSMTIQVRNLERYQCKSHICGVYVNDDYRGRNIAPSLLLFASSKLIEQKLTRIYMSIQSPEMKDVWRKFAKSHPELKEYFLFD